MCLNLKDLDLTKNTALEELYCEKNQLRDLDLSQNTRLKHLECQHNSLYSLDLTNNPHITELRVNNNKLNVQLDLSQNKALTWMYCYDNPHLRTVYVWEGWSRAAMRDWGTDMSASTIVKP